MPYTPIVGFDTQHDANDWNDRPEPFARTNTVTEPGFEDLDLRVVKDFTLKGEGHHLDLFMDVFNIAGSSNRGFGPGSFSVFGPSLGPQVYSGGQALFAPDTTRLGGAREFQFTARLVGF
jgi:hypothetical protein